MLWFGICIYRSTLTVNYCLALQDKCVLSTISVLVARYEKYGLGASTLRGICCHRFRDLFLGR